eukprot:1153631-Pelagomonas_calceolata.AAC.2
MSALATHTMQLNVTNAKQKHWQQQAFNAAPGRSPGRKTSSLRPPNPTTCATSGSPGQTSSSLAGSSCQQAALSTRNN